MLSMLSSQQVFYILTSCLQPSYDLYRCTSMSRRGLREWLTDSLTHSLTDKWFLKPSHMIDWEYWCCQHSIDYSLASFLDCTFNICSWEFGVLNNPTFKYSSAHQEMTNLQCEHLQHILPNILSFLIILKSIIAWMIEKCVDFHYVSYIF